jgi:hypothetical protein
VTDKGLKPWDANRYVNGAEVPYAVWANEWRKWKIRGKTLKLGDFGLAIRNGTGEYSGYFYGDSGTGHKVGECSQKLVNTLAPKPTNDLITFIAFPGSGSGPEMGRNPEGIIWPMVLAQTMKLPLADNAGELPLRLAVGAQSPLPSKQSDMNGEQVRRYKNIMSALRSWGIWKP